MSNGSNSGATGGIGLVTVILALVFLFVWPGPFRYEYRDLPQPAPVEQGEWSSVGFDDLLASASITAAVKIDRISHQVWDYKDGKWVRR